MLRALLPLLLLAACAEFPALDARVTEAERNAPPPALLPLTGLLAAADTVPPAPAFAPGLSAEAAALSARASGLVPAGTGAVDLATQAAELSAQAAAIPAPGATDTERLAALEARAEALRNGVLTGEEEQRLESGPSLP